jgi:hypothetical protein
MEIAKRMALRIEILVFPIQAQKPIAAFCAAVKGARSRGRVNNEVRRRKRRWPDIERQASTPTLFNPKHRTFSSGLEGKEGFTMVARQAAKGLVYSFSGTPGRFAPD